MLLNNNTFNLVFVFPLSGAQPHGRDISEAPGRVWFSRLLGTLWTLSSLSYIFHSCEADPCRYEEDEEAGGMDHDGSNSRPWVMEMSGVVRWNATRELFDLRMQYENMDEFSWIWGRHFGIFIVNLYKSMQSPPWCRRSTGFGLPGRHKGPTPVASWAQGRCHPCAWPFCHDLDLTSSAATNAICYSNWGIWSKMFDLKVLLA